MAVGISYETMSVDRVSMDQVITMLGEPAFAIGVVVGAAASAAIIGVMVTLTWLAALAAGGQIPFWHFVGMA